MSFFGKILLITVVATCVIPIAARQLTPEEQAALTMYKTGKDMETKGDTKSALRYFIKAYTIYQNEYIRYHLGRARFQTGDCKKAVAVLKPMDMSKIEEQYRLEIQKDRKSMIFQCLMKAAAAQKGEQRLRGMNDAIKWASDDQKFLLKSRLVSMTEEYMRGLEDKKAFASAQKVLNWGKQQGIMNMIKASRMQVGLSGKWAGYCRKKGDWACAQTRYTQMLAAAKAVGNEQAAKTAQNWLAVCVDNLRDYVTDSPDSRASYILYADGKRLFLKRKYRVALDKFQKAAVLYDDPHIHFYKGICLLYTGRAQQAAKELTKAQGLDEKAGFGPLSMALNKFPGLKAGDYFEFALALKECTQAHEKCVNLLAPWARQRLNCQVVHFLMARKLYKQADAFPCDRLSAREEDLLLFASHESGDTDIDGAFADLVKAEKLIQQGKIKVAMYLLDRESKNPMVRYLIAMAETAGDKCFDDKIQDLPGRLQTKLDEGARKCEKRMLARLSKPRIIISEPVITRLRGIQKMKSLPIKRPLPKPAVRLTGHRAKAVHRIVINRKPRVRASLKPWAWTTAGIAVAALATGVALVVKANSDINGLQKAISGANPPTMQETEVRYNRAGNMRTGGWAAIGVAGAATISSVVLFILDSKRDRKHRVSVFPSTRGLVFVTSF